ncbi:segregation and condensation protein A [Amorphus orientalis]|uniref:Segregation and condensation protein A n=1 Tax=Amorphus orientalis TaxID=649198 RepID=A0AAE3VPU0_9HYPH|nr:ScpA family protein [Amorphus orientalis]MDQ0315580.1 segregation and condensation protein A [Amorphus orientalis]
MTETETDPFEAPVRSEPEKPDALHLDIRGFEGPLDLLLALARSQKVDLTRISVSDLAEQYLAFIEEARRIRLELAADYLVMAAWLAYLKSRLLVPKQSDDDEEPTGEELAAELAFRLKRLEAMRKAGEDLMARPILGQGVLARGAPEPIGVKRTTKWQASVYDLLSAYASQRQREMGTVVHMRRRVVWSLADARSALERIVGTIADWTPIDELLKRYMTDPGQRPTVLASTFSASLELVREGHLELRQTAPFAPIYVKTRAPDGGET